MNEIKEIYDFRHVVRQLCKLLLTLRYRRTFLGYIWTLLSPLLMMTVTSFVFSSIFKLDIKTFAVFLFSGMLPYIFFSQTVGQCSNSFVENEGIIKKIYIPKILFPFSTSLTQLIEGMLMSVTLICICIFLGAPVSISLIFIPIAYVIMYGFCLGAGLVVSVATVFFRDLTHILPIGIQALIFLSPIFYKPADLSAKVAAYIKLNPLVPYIDLFRYPIYKAKFPPFESIIMATAYSFACLILGVIVYRRYKDKLVYWI